MTTYKSAPSKGVIWGIGLMLFIGLVMAIPIGINLTQGKIVPGFLVLMGFVFAFVISLTGYFTWAAKNMEYILEDQELVIKWAFSRKRIPLTSIRGINRTVGTSSLKIVGASWPGFHMGSFSNPMGKGTVNMYATRLWGDILLIKTKWEIIGITPEDPELFLDDLHRLVPGLDTGSFSDGEPIEPFSPWKDKLFTYTVATVGIIILGTALFLYKIIPTLPNNVPMHFNLSGQVDRYGSPQELYVPFGIGILIIALMLGISGFVARNNKTSAYLIAFVSLFIAIIFSLISVTMALSV